MPDFAVLDTVISVVIVILLLSMVVQSTQTFIKKLLKFKSRQIRQSVDKLLTHVAASAPTDPTQRATAEKVMQHFEKLGRTTAMGNHAVESISKADLSKVITAIEGASLLPAPARDALAGFATSLQEAKQAAEALATVSLPDASLVTLSDARAKLETLIQHVAVLFDKNDRTKVNAALLVRDVSSLGDLDVSALVTVMAGLQTQVDKAAAAEPTNAKLQEAAAAVRAAAAKVAALNVSLTKLLGRLRERIQDIESWYDTVMLGFQERYARHMRTWAFLISIAVVVVMNADVFQVYRRLATSDLSQQRVLTQYNLIQKQYEARTAATPGDAQSVQQVKAELDKAFNEAAASYPALGLEPYDWSMPTGWQVFGWLVMAALLSLGAPFWHDTLESLFGLKNLLRERTDTKKVEQKSGAGLTQS
jgi:hypothetical protein